MLRVLGHIFGHTEESDALLDAAEGSDMALARELTRLATLATPADLAVVAAHFDEVRAKKIVGEITLSSLKKFISSYKKALLNVPPTVDKPSPGTEVQIANPERILGNSVTGPSSEARRVRGRGCVSPGLVRGRAGDAPGRRGTLPPSRPREISLPLRAQAFGRNGATMGRSGVKEDPRRTQARSSRGVGRANLATP